MGKTLTEIAQQLKDADKKVQLIYAFNGVGKTRLSRAFKALIAPKDDAEGAQPSALAQKKILYFSAFTEDLFYWDNDLGGDAEPKLKIQPNAFTTWVLEEQGQDRIVTSTFQHYTNDKLTPNFSADFSEVRFSFERGNNEHEPNIKISKGEESNFIWSVFHSLLEQMISELNIAEAANRSTDAFNKLEYVFVDDPVSSLDENHLYLKHTIEQAIAENEVEKYHFTLLRNLYEKTASFLGYPKWSELLPDDKQLYLSRIINFTSHSTLSNEAVAEPTQAEKATVKLLLDHLKSNYGYWQQVEGQ